MTVRIQNHLALVSLGSAVLAGLPGSAGADGGRIPINQERAVVGGVTATDTPGFPVTIDAAGSYVLTGNLDVSTSGLGAIQVTADDVTIDLGGFRIDGPATCTGTGTTLSCSGAGNSAGIDGGVNNDLTIRNGLIRNFGTGGGVRSGDGARIENVTVHQNDGAGIAVDDQAIVSGCVVVLNDGNGIVVGSGARVVNNTTAGNRSDGINVNESGVARGNVNWANGDDGIHASEAVVVDNVSFQNAGAGFEVYRNTLVIGNAARSNTGWGIHMNSGSSYDHNIVDGNTAGTVLGGVNMDVNVCNGNTTCP